MFSWLKKYFIPHEHNNFKPHFLRYESMLLVFFVVTIVELAFFVQIFIVFDKTSFLASVLPGVLTTLTNKERAQNNAAPLTQNDLLIKAAQLKANDMATRGYFAHVSPDGKTPWYWLDQVGYNYSMAGENLAVNFFESDDVAQAWMDSPTHRANIIKSNYKEIGIGIANGVYEGRNTVFVAQFFGTPLIVPNIPVPLAKSTAVTTSVKPKIPTTIPKTTPPSKPVITPPQTVAVAPTAIRVLGEETTTPVVTTQNTTFISSVKSFIEKAVTSPREYVTYIYIGIALLIVLALLLAIFIKSKIQHPSILVRGLTVIAVIVALLFINIKLLHPETKVPTDTLSASVIAVY